MERTECKKCGAAMPDLARAAQRSGVMSRLKMEITGYLCTECGHFNNLKTRKWWKKYHPTSPEERNNE